MNIFVHGAATTVFGELWDTSPRTLAKRVTRAALDDAGMESSGVEALFVGNMLSGILGNQEHLGAFFADELGLSVAAFKVEGACASGGLAMHNAVAALASGMYTTVVVLGVEKMTDHKPEDVAAALMGAGTDEERVAGATFPGLYAMIAREHMRLHGTTRAQLSAVAVKNHYHASLNPNAQFRKPITAKDVDRSPCIADPLKLLDCSPISDGAAAVVLSTDKPKKGKESVAIVASAVATDTLALSDREDLVGLRATQQAARRAFTQANISPDDVHVAEVHDCFSIAEIVALEDLGLYAKGEAAAAVERGDVTLGKAQHLVVNPSGGLKGCGHPVGATGVKQIVELAEQLRGTAGERQVSGAQIGLAHNVGGSGATAVIHILKRVTSSK